MYCIKKGTGYFSVNIDTGQPRFLNSIAHAYTYEKEQAEAVAKKLRELGHEVEVVDYKEA